MDAKSADIISRILALIAISIALYNAYLGWLDEPKNSYLLVFVLIFVLLSLLAAEYSKKQKR